MNENLDLAKKRTLLAGERTALAWIRTMLVCLSVAFAFMKLDKQHPIDTFTICLFVFSALCLIGAIATLLINYFYIKKIEKNEKKN